MPRLPLFRRLTQLAAAGFFLLVPWLNAEGFHGLRGDLLAFSAFGLPLADPLSGLQTLAATGHIGVPLALGSLTALALAAVLGAVFCSWICPYGLISELNHSLNQRARGPARPWSASGFPAKALAVGGWLVAAAVLGLPPLLDQLSLPGWYSRAAQTWFLAGAVPVGVSLLLAAWALDLLSGRRLWCRYLCPQALLLMVVQRSSPRRWRVVFDGQRCTCADRPSPCGEACSLGLDPRGDQARLELECSNCGDCVAQCAHCGQALVQRFAPRP